MTASATRRECAQASELVTTFRNDANDAVAHAAGDKPFTLTVIRPS